MLLLRMDLVSLPVLTKSTGITCNIWNDMNDSINMYIVAYREMWYMQYKFDTCLVAWLAGHAQIKENMNITK